MAAKLRQSIRSGQFLPNERLIEADLAAQYKTNRANIRTALVRLEQEGLVVHEPNRGARVRFVSDEEAVEIVEVRSALEILNARRAARRASAADKANLEKIVKDMSAALASGDLAGFTKLNGSLHGAIQAISNNRTVERILGNLLFPIVRLQYRTILLPGRAEHALAEHEAIVKAIVASDPDAAAAAMEQHFVGLLAALRRTMELAKAGLL